MKKTMPQLKLVCLVFLLASTISPAESPVSDLTGVSSLAADVSSNPAQDTDAPPFVLSSSDDEATLATGEAEAIDGESEEIDGEAVYVMPDFEVSAEKDKGFLSSSSLSATRTNSLIKDTPMSISVINQELIDDLNLNTIGDISDVLANVDREAFNSLDDNRNIKMRGLMSKGQLFEFFPRSLPQSGYNVGRTDVLMGTNSLVLGQSGAGGKANSSGKGASFGNDKTHLELIVGDHNTTGVVGRNMQVSETVAVHAQAASSEKTSNTENALNQFNGGTVAVKWRPNQKTQVSLNLEAVDSFVRNAVNGWSVDKNLAKKLGLPIDAARFTPDILDPMPSHMLNEVDALAAANGGGSLEKTRDYLNKWAVDDDSDYGIYEGDETGKTTRGYLGIIDVTHAFTDSLQGKLAYFHETTEINKDSVSGAASVKDDGSVEAGNPYIQRGYSKEDEEKYVNSVRGTLAYDIEFKEQTHQVLLGFDYDHSKRETDKYSLGNDDGGSLKSFKDEKIYLADSPDLYDLGFRESAPGQSYIKSKINNVTKTDAAIWTALTSRFFDGRLNTMAGLRRSYYEASVFNHNLTKGDNIDPVDSDTRGYGTNSSIGAVFWFNRYVGLVGSYSQSVQTNDGVSIDPTGAPQAPEEGTGKEIGLRFEFDELNVSAEIMGYSIRRDNANISKSDIPLSYLMENYPNEFINDSGEFEDNGANGWKLPGTSYLSEGIDASINYNPTKALSFRMTYNTGKLTIDESLADFLVGERTGNTAKHSGTFTARYKFVDGPLVGAYVGANVKVRSGYRLKKTFYKDLDSDGKIDSYEREVGEGTSVWLDPEVLTDFYMGWNGQFAWFDGKGRGKPVYGVQLNVKNLFDNRQFTNGYRNLEPRSFTVKFTADF